ncbi:phosphatidate cytidylyltransferase [Paraflavitalea pollutisoli]|uniref:phosphatidate cytidylyltransferase n=1 Tax=Paraflavitalea pollutisoli TaxID=3034143 RepID=UPI0023EA7CD4|nr:phosphatidate cytidylyltransferase [Paraflavitalea sp. H1-2-19X]
MMRPALVYTLLAMFLVSLSSCEVIGGIFKAGVWTGILVVAVVVGLLIWLIAKMGGKK